MVAEHHQPDQPYETPHELLAAFCERARNPEVVAAATMLVADVELSVSGACQRAAQKSSPETVRSGLRGFLKELKPLRAREDEWVAKLLKKGRLRTVEDPTRRLGRAGLDVVVPTTIGGLGEEEREALFDRLAEDALLYADVRGHPLNPAGWVVKPVLVREGDDVRERDATRVEQKARKKAARKRIDVLEALVLDQLGYDVAARRTGETVARVRAELDRVLFEIAPREDVYPWQPVGSWLTVPLDRLGHVRATAHESGDPLDVKYETTLVGERALVRARVRIYG